MGKESTDCSMYSMEGNIYFHAQDDLYALGETLGWGGCRRNGMDTAAKIKISTSPGCRIAIFYFVVSH
jgi:hypothetical protein